MKLKKYGMIACTAATVLTLAACNDGEKDNNELKGDSNNNLGKEEIKNVTLEKVSLSDDLKNKINSIDKETKKINHFESYEWLSTPNDVNALMVEKSNIGLIKENIKIEHFNAQGDKALRHTYKDTFLLGLSDLDITYEFQNNIKFEAKVEEPLLAKIIVTLYNTDLEKVATKLEELVGKATINTETVLAYDTDTTEMIGKKDEKGNIVLIYEIKENVYANLK